MDNKTAFKIYSLVTADQVAIKISTLDVLYQNNDTFVLNHLQSETQKEVDKLNQRGVENIPEEELLELTRSISDYYGLSHETKEVLSHYMIVATFSFYEKGLKKLLSLTKQLTPQELRNCYRKDQLTQLLTNKFSITYSTLSDYAKIEELRCLNNDIKHNGVVGNELVSSNGKWILDQDIENTHSDFERLKEGPRNLLADLAAKIEPFI
jgi:hypothetical protein